MIGSIFRAVGTLIATTALAACASVGGTVKSWTETIGTANVWEPVEQVVETTSEARLGASLERVAAAAKFAERELGLPRNGSFEVVARSSRGAEGWRVVAVPEFGFEAVRYCGTVSGCAPERVYRSRSEALSDAEILRKAGNDVDVAPVMLAHRARGTPLPHWILSWPAAAALDHPQIGRGVVD